MSPEKAVVTAAAVLLAAASCGGDGETGAVEPWPDRIELALSDSIDWMGPDGSFRPWAIGDVCFGSGGEVLVMDQASGEVIAFSREGEHLASFSGRGEGPGETSIPLALARLSDGRLLLLDPGANSYEVFDGSDFHHIEEVALWDNNPPQDPWGLDGGYYLGLKFRIRQEEDRITGINTLGRFAMGMEEPEVVYMSNEFQIDPADLGSMVRNMLRSVVYTGDRQGRVFYSEMSTEEYSVTACDSSGRVLFTISARIPSRARSEVEMAEEKAWMEQWISRMGGMGGFPVEWQPEPFRWMITGLGVDSAGRLWVQRGTGDRPVLDVFDRSGSHLFSAEFPREGYSWRFHIEEQGILAWNEDPEDGRQKVYLLDLP